MTERRQHRHEARHHPLPRLRHRDGQAHMGLHHQGLHLRSYDHGRGTNPIKHFAPTLTVLLQDLYA